MNPAWLNPDWPAPPKVRAAVTTRLGGVSEGPFRGFNLATHVGDDPSAVAENRRLLQITLSLPEQPCWLEQVHGVHVMDAAGLATEPADASVAFCQGPVCAVLTADCLPVLFCDVAGTRVGAAHAGWRGLLAGVLQNTARRLATGSVSASLDSCSQRSPELLAWLGPAIGPSVFEVGDEVRAAFLKGLAGASVAFAPHSQGKWLADLYALARLALAQAGVTRIYGRGYCTFTDAERFYSYRRDGVTGRMASLIWLEE